MSIKVELEYWDKAAQDPDVDIKYISDIDDDKCLAEILPHLKHHHVLEIGCGVGRLTSRLYASSQHGCCQIHGIDISEKMLKLAEQNTPSKPDVRYKLCDGRTIPDFECCKEFDSVYSILTFQHIPDEAKLGYIKEAARVLKSGGIFRVQYVDGDYHADIHHQTSEENMVKWFEDSGFNIDQIDRGKVHPQWTWITGVKI